MIVLGAHMGDEVIHYAKAVTNKGKVIAVEPAQENFDILNFRITRRGLHWVKTIRAAMNGRNGRTNIYIGTNSTNNSIVKDWKYESEEVDGITWDKLTEELGPITLANIDIEGAELSLLDLGMNVNLPKYIILEYHYMFDIDKNDLIRLLNRKGYSCTIDNQYIYAKLGV